MAENQTEEKSIGTLEAEALAAGRKLAIARSVKQIADGAAAKLKTALEEADTEYAAAEGALHRAYARAQ